MARKPYRVEMIFPKKGKPKYYLVRDVKVRNKKRKARKYIGVVQPTLEDVEHYRTIYAREMEVKAAVKKAELSASFQRSLYLTEDEIITLEKLRWLYQSVLELMTADEIEAYQEHFEIRYIQGTTEIEGNTLSYPEAANLLLHGITPDRKQLREINEIQNFKTVVKYRDSYKGRVTVDFIKTLHSLILNNIDFESAGTFRRIDNIVITGCDLAVTPAIMIEEELERIIKEYYDRLDEDYHPLEQAALFHYAFEMIHPFNDGNGRIGREVFNYMLRRSKYPRLLFLGLDREEYISALECGNEENLGEMVTIFANIILRQRMKIIEENITALVKPVRKTGQLRLYDFDAPSD